MSDLRTDYTNDILAEEMNGKRRFKIVKSDGTSETVSIEDVTKYDQTGSLFGAGDFNKTNQKVNEAYNRPVNNNILINSNFTNPVNQRGITAETWKNTNGSDIYGLDRWKCANANGAVKSLVGGITIDSSSENVDLRQNLEKGTVTLGKTYTVSACIDGVIYKGSVKLIENTYYNAYESDAFNLMLVYNSTTQGFSVYVRFKSGKGTHTITWAKLEEGDHATPYVPRLYAEELQLCKKYYQKIPTLLWSKVLKLLTDNIEFIVTIPIEMRVAPTVIIPNTNSIIYTDNDTRTNCTVTTSGIASSFIGLVFTKANHGISAVNIPRITDVIELDAEL